MTLFYKMIKPQLENSIFLIESAGDYMCLVKIDGAEGPEWPQKIGKLTVQGKHWDSFFVQALVLLTDGRFRWTLTTSFIFNHCNLLTI